MLAAQLATVGVGFFFLASQEQFSHDTTQTMGGSVAQNALPPGFRVLTVSIAVFFFWSPQYRQIVRFNSRNVVGELLAVFMLPPGFTAPKLGDDEPTIRLQSCYVFSTMSVY